MTKKVLYLFFTLVLLMTSGCGKANVSKDNVDNQKDNASEQIGEKGTTAATKEKGVEVDKGLLNVEITLPKDFLGEDDIDHMIDQAKADGVKEITKNEDGSLTYKMSKSVYKDMMKEMESNTLEYIEEIKNTEDFVSIKDITSNKSFSEFTMVVEKDSFENSFDGFAAMGLGMSGLFYQIFAGTAAEDAKVTISLKDDESGEVFNTVVYPDDLDEENGL